MIPSAYLSMWRELIAFALVWQGTWRVSDPDLWPSTTGTASGGLLFAGTCVTWLLILIFMLTSRSPKRIGTTLEVLIDTNRLLVVGAGIALSLNSVGPGENEWFLAASLFNLAAGICGLMVHPPWQWLIVVIVVSLEAAIFLSLGFFESERRGRNSTILYFLYVLAAGVALARVQHMLLRRARGLNGVRQQALRQVMAVKTAVEIDTYIKSFRRQIHETVLNTLTAISRGSLKDSEESRRLIGGRTAESALILSDLSRPPIPGPLRKPGGMIEPLRDLLIECSERGIEARVVGDTESMPPAHVV